MKLLALHVDAFGKLRDLSLEFDGELTEIAEENGYGKTTLAAFIKAMLYGIPDNRDKGKVRKKYAPWSGGDFGGTLDIETERGRYRIVRRFTPKTGDSFELLSLETLLPSDDYGENIGFELFAVDADSYEKTVYLPQHGVDIKMTDSIGARLTQLLEGSNDMLDFSEALEKIRSRRRELELYRGEGGLIADAKNELSECEKRIALFEEKLRDAAEAKNNAEALGAEMLEIENDINALSERLFEENEKKLIKKDAEIYLGLVSEYEKSLRELEKTRAAFSGEIPSKEELSKNEELAREISFIRRKRAELCTAEADGEEYRRLCAAFDGGTPSAYELTRCSMDARDIEKKRAELEAQRQELEGKDTPHSSCDTEKNKSRRSLVCAFAFCGVGIIVALLGLLASLTVTVIGAVIAVAGGALTAYFAVSANSAKRAEREKREEYEKERSAKKAELLKTEKELAELEFSVVSFFEKYKVDAKGKDLSVLVDELAASARKYEEIRAKKLDREKSINKLDAEIEQKERELFAFLGAYGFIGENEKTPEEIRELCDRVEQITKETLERREKAEAFKGEKNLPDVLPEISIDTKSIEAAITAAQKALQAKGAEQSRLCERAERLEAEAETLPMQKDKREELAERIAEYTERRDIYDKTEKLLTEAKENLSSRYVVDMKNGFADRFAAITGNSREITLDTKLEIKLRDEGGAKKADAYSAGWRSVIAVCLRLALIDALYKDERPFIILDDPFVDLDENKLERAISVLKEISKTTQTVYLTCHKSRSCK